MFNLQTTFSKIGFWSKKHSPELLIIGGIVSSAAAIATAIMATTKVKKTLQPYSEKIKAIRADLHDDNKIQNKIVDVKIARKDLAVTYAKAGGKLLMLYSPSAILFLVSTSCILGSHKIMQNRNIALAATCTAIERSYNAYRERVKQKVGEDIEEKLYKNIQEEKVEVKDPDTGKVKTKKISSPHVSYKDGEPWEVLFDCGNSRWETDAQLNFDWLMDAEAYLTTKLQRQGYLFLSDVWEYLGYNTAMLGPEKSRAAHILGWIYDPKNPRRSNCVNFGLTEPGSRYPLPSVAKQLHFNEPSFYLNINVDGDILSGEYGKEVFSNYARSGGAEAGGHY